MKKIATITVVAFGLLLGACNTAAPAPALTVPPVIVTPPVVPPIVFTPPVEQPKPLPLTGVFQSSTSGILIETDTGRVDGRDVTTLVDSNVVIANVDCKPIQMIEGGALKDIGGRDMVLRGVSALTMIFNGVEQPVGGAALYLRVVSKQLVCLGMRQVRMLVTNNFNNTGKPAWYNLKPAELEAVKNNRNPFNDVRALSFERNTTYLQITVGE